MIRNQGFSKSAMRLVLAVLAICSSLVVLHGASGASTAHDSSLPTTYGDGIAVPCTKDWSYNYTCLSSTGYQGQAIWGANYPDTSGHNCTSYVAWRLRQNGAGQFTVPGANDWGGSLARSQRWAVNQSPAVGSIAWWGPKSSAGSYGGHVAYVEGVGSNYVDVSEDIFTAESAAGEGKGPTVGYDDTRRLYNSSAPGSGGWPTDFIHIKDLGGDGGAGGGGTMTVPSQNLLKDGSFETGAYGWSGGKSGGVARYTVGKGAPAIAHDGSSYFAFNGSQAAGASVFQDVTVPATAWQSYTATAWISSQAGQASGSFCVWGLGPNTNSCVHYSATAGTYTQFQVVYDAPQPLTGFRVQFYPGSGTTDIDSVSLE